MINNLKKYFTNINGNKNYLKLNINGTKFYVNDINDIYLKKNYKFNKYIFGYNYNLVSYNFNTLCSLFKIIDKKNREYAYLIKHINLFNNNFLFLKNNDLHK